MDPIHRLLLAYDQLPGLRLLYSRSAPGRHRGSKFHDLHHETTSRLFENGLNIIEGAGITGRKSLWILRRYKHLNAEIVTRKMG